MKHLIAVANALTRVPGWNDRDSSWREIRGGLTNRSYLVRAKGRDFVLRLDAEPAKALGLDRHTELLIHRRAASAGIAPEVVFADPDDGVLIYEYLPGPVWERDSLADRHNLETVAALLRKVHALPRSGVPFDASAIARRYAKALPDDQEALAERCLDIIADALSSADPACCHNDVVAGNIVGAGRIRLLDWEYACDNDPFFDLATLIGYHGLDRESARTLLSAYTGAPAAADQERLAAQLRLYDAIERLWFAVVGAVKPESPGIPQLA